MEIFGFDARLFWFFLGIAFLVLEALTPGFFLMFFGLGAWAAALLVLFLPGAAQFWQWLVFMAVSVVTLLVLRSKLKSLFEGRLAKVDNLEDPVVSDRYLDQEVVVLEDIAPDQPGRVELNGTSWQARTADGRSYRAGERARVARLEGLTLIVGPSGRD